MQDRARYKEPAARARSSRSTPRQEVILRGVGFHFPPDEVSTVEILQREQPAKLFGGQMRAAIGCEKIHVARPGDSPSALAAAAAERALAHAGLGAGDIDLLVGVSCTPADFDLWSMPAKIAERIGAMGAECFGVGDTGCAGAFAAMRATMSILRDPEGPERALVAAGAITPGGHFFPPATIFGDGAGALVLERTTKPPPARGTRRREARLRVVRADFYSHPHLVDAFGCQAGIDLMRAEGRLDRRWWTVGIKDQAVYSALRVTNFDLGADALRTSLERARWPVDSLTWLVPDNVSAKVGEELARRVDLPLERVLSENCARYGHAFVADLFVNLRTIIDLHPPSPGDRIACLGMGLGQHWGVVLIEA